MMVVKRRFAALVAAGALVTGLAACGGSDTPAPEQTGQPDAEPALKIATTDRITALDPAGVYDVGSRTLQSNLYQTLLTITADKPTPVPDAADCQFDAPTTYTCSLRDKLTFANGHRLTASDVKFSFDRMLRLRTPGGPAALFASIASVSTPDELTAVFTLRKPDARLPYLFTTTAASIVDEETYPAGRLLTGTVAGSGPYRLTAYRPGSGATLAKFEKYLGPRPARNDGVELSFLRDSAALTAAVTGGRAELAYHGFGASDLTKLRAEDQVQVIDEASAETRFLAFPFRSPVARRPAVRRAVAQVVDRSALIRRVYGDRVTPLTSVVPPGFTGHVDAFTAAYGQPNRTAAAATLRQGGVTAPVPLRLGWTPTQYGAGARAEVTELKRQLEASGLFRVTLVSAEWPRYQQLARSGAFDVYHSAWLPDYPDSDAYLAPFVRDGAPYQNGYRSQTAIRLLDQQVAEQNQAERERLLGSVQAVIAQDAPLIPLWQDRLTVVAGKELRNVPATLNQLSSVSFSALRK